MGSIPYAFSVHHFINSVGSDAGFAAIIGLAIVILLYFAHARETASLREQVYEWAQRVAQLEARVTQLSRQQASLSTPASPAEQQAAVPAAVQGATQTAVGRTRAPAYAGAPAGAPAGVAAPALTAATKLIPTAVGVREGEPQPPMHAGELPPDATGVVAPPPPQPVTAAGGANGSAYDHMADGGGARTAAPLAPPPPRMQIRQGTTVPPGRRGTVPPRNQPPRQKRSRGRRGFAVLLVALIAVAIVAGLLILTSNNGNQKQASSSTRSRNTAAPASSRAKAATPVKPASVTVAVLNGTATSGLAGRVSQKLTTDSYKPGTVATAADQTRTSTEVAYLSGHRGEALAVAKSLNLGSASVQAVDPSTQAVACPPPAACTADVVVTVGTDLANTQ